MQCKAGCSGCCQDGLTVFALEADPIRQAVASHNEGTRARVRAQADDPARTTCALLLDGQCVVYAERPLLCRSHGLPLVAEDRTSHCALNFVSQPPSPASHLALERVHAPLAIAAEMYAPRAPRVALAELGRDA